MVAAAVPLLAAAGTAGTAAAATTGATIAGVSLATIGTALTIGSTLYGAYSQHQAGKAEAAQYKFQAESARVKAMQDEANRQARLTEILNTQMAQTAGRGVQVGGGSDLAIADFSTAEAQRESDIASLDSKYQQTKLKYRSKQARKAGKASLINGIAQAGNTAYGAYTRYSERQLTSEAAL